MAKPAIVVYDNDTREDLTDLNDVTITSPADKDVMSYDLATATWLNKTFLSIGIAGITVSTRSAILSLSPTAGKMAYATDENLFYVADGTSWRESAIEFMTRSTNDMGSEVSNPLSGYSLTWITDKILNNCVIGGSKRTDNGTIQVNTSSSPDTFEIYLRSQWNTIIYDLTTIYGDFRHAPIGELVKVWNGMSAILGMNGRPVINEYTVDMGVYPAPRIINGGSF